MPRGGSRDGSGRPEMAPELKKGTTAFSLNPILIKTISDVAKQRGISKSELVESILIQYFEE